MKTIIAAIALAAVTAVPASANTCVRQREIVSTHSDDGKNLIFRMHDGRVLVNHLQGICTDLRYEGFVWNVPGTEDICENQQTFQVIQSGQSCTLGKFEVVKKDKAAAPIRDRSVSARRQAARPPGHGSHSRPHPHRLCWSVQ